MWILSILLFSSQASETQDCPICLHPVTHGNEATAICSDPNHLVHKDCIQQWQPKCPLCRGILEMDDFGPFTETFEDFPASKLLFQEPPMPNINLSSLRGVFAWPKLQNYGKHPMNWNRLPVIDFSDGHQPTQVAFYQRNGCIEMLLIVQLQFGEFASRSGQTNHIRLVTLPTEFEPVMKFRMNEKLWHFVGISSMTGMSFSK